MDEEAVEQVQIRIRMAECEDDDRLVDVRDRRADQLIFPWEDANDGTLMFLFRILYRFDLRIITDERLFIPIPEDAPVIKILLPVKSIGFTILISPCFSLSHLLLHKNGSQMHVDIFQNVHPS